MAAALTAAGERGLSAVELAVALDGPVRAVQTALTRGSAGPLPRLARHSPRGRWFALTAGQPVSPPGPAVTATATPVSAMLSG